MKFAISRQIAKNFFQKVQTLPRYGVHVLSDDLTIFHHTQIAVTLTGCNIFNPVFSLL